MTDAERIATYFANGLTHTYRVEFRYKPVRAVALYIDDKLVAGTRTESELWEQIAAACKLNADTLKDVEARNERFRQIDRGGG